MPNFLKKFLKFIALGLVLVPVKNNISTPQVTANQNGKGSITEKDEDDPEVLGVENSELVTDLPGTVVGQFYVNDDSFGEQGGIVVDGQKNRYVSLQYSNELKQSLLRILKVFHPEFSQHEAEEYLANYKMLVGDDVDYYLETVRKGSWGTTVMSVSGDGKVHFRSISLRQSMLSPNYKESRPGALNQLIQEEFFQAHQYEAVVANLYNSGYLQVAEIDSVEEVNAAVSTGNLRAFLELFSQQKYLHDTHLGRNSYNYYIDGHFFDGSANSDLVVNNAYAEFVTFIQEKLGIQCSIETFLDSDSVKDINEEFRRKYLWYYKQQGIPDSQVQIWNLVGMYRVNTANSENTLNMRAVLDWPEEI